MLTRLVVRNFKRFDEIDIDLGSKVVFIGPNNSGKTTALQALTLWDVGLKRWIAKYRGKTTPKERPSVTINRRDLISIPVPYARLLWRDLLIRNVEFINKKQSTTNICIDIIVEGISDGKKWKCGLEFDWANEESLYCRSLRTGLKNKPTKEQGAKEKVIIERMTVPEEAHNTRVAFLPPMSGLASVEPKLEQGRINVLIGEGQTAQVFRNLCYSIYESGDKWETFTEHIKNSFGVELLPPKYVSDRGELTMEFKEQNGVILDLSSQGSGFHHTVLLLAHLYANPNTVLLLDEPDAHLEILRQRQIYQLLSDVAEEQRSQIIISSHSEVILNEAAGSDLVVAFLGKPHPITDRGSQLAKSLSKIGYDQYLPALQKGWVLYLEGSTDLKMLISFSKKLDHPVKDALENAFVRYVSNEPSKVRDHFFGLREAKDDLRGVAVFDHLDKELKTDFPLLEQMWRKNELENYFCTKEVLISFARYDLPEDDLFGKAEAVRREKIMRESIEEIEKALETIDKPSPWSDNIKVTDDFLDPLFKKYFQKLELPNLFRKKQYHELVRFMPKDRIDPEIVEKLDLIYEVSQSAKPE